MGRKFGKAKKQAKQAKRGEYLRKRDPKEQKTDDRDKAGYENSEVWEENIYYDFFYKVSARKPSLRRIA